MNWGRYQEQMERLSDGQRREAIRFAERLVEQNGLSPDDAVWAALVHHTPPTERDSLALRRLAAPPADDLFAPLTRAPRSTWDE